MGGNFGNLSNMTFFPEALEAEKEEGRVRVAIYGKLN